MKKVTLALYLFMGYGFIIYNGIAQNKLTKTVDTLRRELTVVNAEKVSVTAAQPLSTKFDSPIPSIKPLQYNLDYSAMYYIPSSYKAISHLPNRFIPEPQSYNQHGYIDLSGGLKYNAGLLGSIRLLNSQKHQLRIDIDLRGTEYYRIQKKLNDNIKSRHYAGQIQYQYRGTLTYIQLASRFRENMHNYYGLYIPYDVQPTHQVVLPHKTSQYFDVDFRIKNLLQPDTKWLYDAKILLRHTLLQLSKVKQQNKKMIGWDTHLDGSINYLLTGDSKFIISSNADLSIYSDNQITQSQNRGISSLMGIISSKVNYSYSTSNRNYSWNIDMGIGLTIPTSGVFGKSYLWPYIKFNNAWSRYVQLTLGIDGGYNYNSFYDVEAFNPYYGINSLFLPDRIRYRGYFELQVLPMANLQFNVFGSLLYKDQALQFQPQKFLSDAISPIYFSPYYIKYRKNQVGVGAKYSYQRLLTISGKVIYQSYNTKNASFVTGVPSLLSNINLTYQPNEKIKLLVNYQVRDGIKYRSVLVNTIENLPNYQTISGQADYILNKYISVYLQLQTTLGLNNGKSILYYPQQYAMGLLGLRIKF